MYSAAAHPRNWAGSSRHTPYPVTGGEERPAVARGDHPAKLEVSGQQPGVFLRRRRDTECACYIRQDTPADGASGVRAAPGPRRLAGG